MSQGTFIIEPKRFFIDIGLRKNILLKVLKKQMNSVSSKFHLKVRVVPIRQLKI